MATNDCCEMNNTSKPSVVDEEYPLSLVVGYGILYVAFFTFAFFGNIMALLTCYKKYHTSQSILLCYISSLALADLLFAVLSIFDTVYFFLGDWPGGNPVCKIQGTLIEISYSASILTLVAISYERSRSVTSTSLARNRCVEQRTIVIKILWIVSVVLCAPLFYGYATKEEKGVQLCLNTNWGDSGRQTYYILQAVFIFICPLIFMIWAHTRILRVLRTHVKNTSGLGSVESKQHKVTKMLAVVTLVFFCCWSPFIIVRALRYFYVYEGNELWKLTQLIIFGNSAANPILYCFYSGQFRRSFKEIIRCKFKIEARRKSRTGSHSTFALHKIRHDNVKRTAAIEVALDSTLNSSTTDFL
ncbi:type-2 angiotensin II receptor-like [Stylophora pistillata]|uniref:type-2 angiotensin II receptor-like n=1 Tax=Stylophora pistillata TaxID=50429 RepID=UPI000C052636|nr:type-2 angiotensin II receptor-like [Stylophora pistillata]